MSLTVERKRLRRHPLQGFFGGLFVGMGVLILLVILGAAAFTAWWPFVVIAGGCALLGVVVGLFAPARKTAP